MAATISIEEGQPTSWPQVDPDDDGAVPITPVTDEPPLRKFARVAWQRVEAWIIYRWSVRAVVFIVEGPGEWVPPLRPFTPTTIEAWVENAWTTVTVAPSALGGYCFDGIGPYRFTGNLGAATAPPSLVTEAVWRLVKFMEATDAMPADERSLTRHKVEVGGALTIEREQATNWIARAMQQSGAADLLRPWRNLGTR